jgi:hypothetical protein
MFIMVGYCSICVPVVNYSLEFLATVEALTETTY